MHAIATAHLACQSGQHVPFILQPPRNHKLEIHMPKRRVKRVGWEVESERLLMKPSMERRMRKARLARAAGSLSEWESATSQEEAFYAIADAALAAYDMEKFSDAEAIAQKALELAPLFGKNWNVGNALFAGHTVLGLLALRRGDVEQAIQELHESAKNPGSPQLGSFGPTMRLAKELLKRGETEAVIAFLHQCLAFWTMGHAWVAVWEKKIRRGLIPHFMMNLHT